MITKLQSEKHIALYKPIQLEIQKVMFLLEKAMEQDELVYVFSSPSQVLDYLRQADEGLKDTIDHLHHHEELEDV